MTRCESISIALTEISGLATEHAREFVRIVALTFGADSTFFERAMTKEEHGALDALLESARWNNAPGQGLREVGGLE